MRLIFVRHGETEENKAKIVQGHKPGKLSAQGLEQARNAAARLKDETIDVIYSSDLDRCVKTTAEIARFHKAEIIYTPEIRERCLGIYEGKRRELLGDLKRESPDFKPENGESLEELSKRAAKFMEKVIAKHKSGTVLISSHGGFIRVAIARLKGMPLEEALKTDLGNTAVCIFEIAKWGNVKEVCMNCSRHLNKP